LGVPHLDQSEAQDIIPAMKTDFAEGPQARLWRNRYEPPEDPERLLLDAIANGELDPHLAALADAIHARRVLLHTVRSASALAELCIGDAVRINRHVRPRYLYGEYGVIADLDDHSVTVRLVRPIGRFRSGEIRCPPLALDKLDHATWQPAA
jgi:hypothetical protein